VVVVAIVAVTAAVAPVAVVAVNVSVETTVALAGAIVPEVPVVVERSGAVAAGGVVAKTAIPPPHPQQTEVASSPSTPNDSISSTDSPPSLTALQTLNSRYNSQVKDESSSQPGGKSLHTLSLAVDVDTVGASVVGIESSNVVVV
jgi:hypothetical protein